MNSTHTQKIPEKSLFMNNDSYYSLNSAPTESFRLLLLSVEKEFTSVKAIYSPWFQQSPEDSKASSSLYKELSASFFNRSNCTN